MCKEHSLYWIPSLDRYPHSTCHVPGTAGVPACVLPGERPSESNNYSVGDQGSGGCSVNMREGFEPPGKVMGKWKLSQSVRWVGAGGLSPTEQTVCAKDWREGPGRGKQTWNSAPDCQDR